MTEKEDKVMNNTNKKKMVSNEGRSNKRKKDMEEANNQKREGR